MRNSVSLPYEDDVTHRGFDSHQYRASLKKLQYHQEPIEPMSMAGEIIRPIVGLATNRFIPLSETQYIFACLYMPLPCATLLFWVVLLVAIVRDRHYEDANNLLIMSFALADIVCSSTSLHSAISMVIDHGYSRGFTGKVQ